MFKRRMNELFSENEMHERHSSIDQSNLQHIGPGHPEYLADKQVFDVLGAMRDPINDKYARGARKGIDDPDDRLLRKEVLMPPGQRKKRSRHERAPERDEIRRRRVMVKSKQDRKGRSE